MTRNQWHLDSETHRYSIDISDATAGTIEAPAQVPCAGCAMTLALRWFTVTRDGEGDIQTWTLRHSCGATMTIFND